MVNPEKSEFGRVEIFEGLKQEIITLGLGVQTPEDFAEFKERITGFIEADTAPLFVKVEMLKVLDTQSRRKDVREVVVSLKENLREEAIRLSAEDRVLQMQLYADFAMDAQDKENIEKMMDEIDEYLDKQEPMSPKKQPFDEIAGIGNDVVREAEVRKMEDEERGGAGKRLGDEAEDFLKREISEK